MKTSIRQRCFYETASQNNNDGQKNEPPTPPVEQTYTQKEYEAAIAGERKRAQEANRNTIAELTKLKNDNSLSQNQQAALQQQIDELESTLLTKEELQKRVLEQKENEARIQIENLTKDASIWKTRFESSLIERSLMDAAVKEGAFDPGIFSSLLRDKVVTVQDEQTGTFKVQVKLDGQKDGKPAVLTFTPEEAIQHMKNQPNRFGYLFKGTASSGTGGNNNPNEVLGKLDLTKLTPDEYRKYRQQIMES